METCVLKSDDGLRAKLELRSFGRRRGRKLSPRQQHLMDTLLPCVAVGPERADVLAALVQQGEMWIEVGFGGGEHLVYQARANPQVTLIGCEPFEEGLAKVLTAIEEQGLENIRLYGDDARELLRIMPEGSVRRAFVLFPDPWPKKKHQKRRLVSGPLFDLLARVVVQGGELRIATDIADYARTILMAVQRQSAFEWLAAGGGDWSVRPHDWPETRYEQKARREGRPCCYLRLRRID